jgi:hypothetical protein
MIASLSCVPHQVLQFTAVKEVGKLHSTAKEFATILLTERELQVLQIIRSDFRATNIQTLSFAALGQLRRWASRSIEESIRGERTQHGCSTRVITLARQLGAEVSLGQLLGDC